MDLSESRALVPAPAQPVLAYSPHPILLAQDRELVYALFLPNETIAAYLARVGLAERMGNQPFKLTVDGRRMPRALWARCRPKPGTLINLYALVRGGDGQKKNPLATVAMIAVMIFAPEVGAAFGGGFTGGVIQAGFVLGAGLIVNELFPPPRPELSNAQNLGGGDSPTYAIGGGANRMRRYEPMPKIVGVHRVFPDFSAQPYNEFEGEEQVAYFVFNLGYNAADLSDYKIGDTPIGNFEGVEIEVSGADGKLALFPGNVDSQAGVELTNALGFVSRTSSPNGAAHAVEITGALFYFANEGTAPRSAEIDIEYRQAGGGAWTGLQFAPDTVPATSIVNGVARVPVADYNMGVRKEITAQPGVAGLTVLSANVATAAGGGELQIQNSADQSAGGRIRYRSPGGSFGELVRVDGGGGQFVLYDQAKTSNILISVDWEQLKFYIWFPIAAPEQFTVGAEIAGRFMLLNATRAPLRRTFYWHTAQGQYEIRVRKPTPDETSVRAAAQIVWSQLRTYQPDAADYTGQLRIGLKIRASALLQGSLQQFSCVARAKTTVFGGGNALDFDGAVAYVDLLGASGVSLASSFSIEAWINTSVVGADRVILNFGVSGSSYFAVVNGKLDFRNVTHKTGTLDVASGQAVHVAVVVDRGADSIAFYVNGALDNSQAWGLGNLDGQPSKIGSRAGSLFWDGVLDGMRIYSARVLTAAEVGDHYRGRYDDESRLVGRWEFDEGAGVTANDSSGNGNHGTLVNGPAWVAGDPAVPRANVHTSNPAWWELDALRGTTVNGMRVYGAGLADARIDIEGLKLFGAWCDASGQEMNAVFDQQISVHNLLNAIALMGRGTHSLSTGKHGVLWDAPDLPVTALFGMHNIVAGSFSIDYATGDLADIIEGWYYDALREQRDFVRCRVPGTTGSRVKRLELFGRTKRELAIEDTNLYAAANAYRARRYKWRADWEMQPVPRGDVAQIGHDLLNMLSGRFIEGGDTSTLKLPRKVPLYAAGSYVTIRKPDATFATYAVQGGAGDTDTLTLVAPLPFNPWADPDGYPPYDYRWHYGPTSTTGRKVKIESLKPVSERYVDVSAIDEDPLYYAAKSNLPEAAPPHKVVGEIQLSDLQVTEDGMRAGTGYLARVFVTWSVTGDYAGADVRVSVNGGPMSTFAQDVRGRVYSFTVSDFSDVVIEVIAWTSVGKLGRSARMTLEHHIDYAGQSRPSDVVDFTLDGNTFRWSSPPEVDITGFILRYHYGENRSIGDAERLHQGALTSSPATFLELPAGLVTFMLTAVDAAGLESPNAAVIVRNLGDPALENIVETIDFRALAWPGTVTGGTNVAGDLVADDLTDFYGPDDAPFYGADAADFYEDQVFAEMRYETAMFYFPSEWAGSRVVLQHAIDGEGIHVEFRTTNNEAFYGADAEDFYGPDAEPFYGADGAWRPWTGAITYDNGDLQLAVTTGGSPIQGVIRELTVLIDVPDIDEVIDNVVTAPGGTRLALTKPFKLIENIQLTVQADGGTARSARILDRDVALGPLVECIDNTQASVSGLLDARVKGR